MSARRSRDERRVWRRCEALVAAVEIPVPFDFEAMCSSYGAAQRGRPLVVVYEDLVSSGLPCGMWVPLPDQDVLVVDGKASPLHRRQIGLHEFGHVLCDHDGGWTELGEDNPVLGDLAPHLVRSYLGRSTYDQDQEREAEMVATMLGERAASDHVVMSPLVVGRIAGDDALAELRRAMGGRSGSPTS